MSTISLFRSIEHKHDVYSGKSCMKRFCESLREHAMKIINYKKKKMKSLTNENAKLCYICKEKIEIKYLKDKIYREVRDHCQYTGEYRGSVHSIYNLKYTVPKKTLIAFYNGSNYDYHFIIKDLAEEFKNKLPRLRENYWPLQFQ